MLRIGFLSCLFHVDPLTLLLAIFVACPELTKSLVLLSWPRELWGVTLVCSTMDGFLSVYLHLLPGLSRRC